VARIVQEPAREMAESTVLEMALATAAQTVQARGRVIMAAPIGPGRALAMAAQIGRAPAVVTTVALIDPETAAGMQGQTVRAAAMVAETPARIDQVTVAEPLLPSAPHRAAARLITSAAATVALERIVNAAKPAGPVEAEAAGPHDPAEEAVAVVAALVVEVGVAVAREAAVDRGLALACTRN